jgi:pyruvate formate lyase activating enzyme
VDPVEKKPLYHFLPGSRCLSFGTAGCNLDCQFCQNWRISRTTMDSLHGLQLDPHAIAEQALRQGCSSVAFTYNDPVVFAELALETAEACHATGLRTIAVTAGYISGAARAEFFGAMDAVNVDLKAFNEVAHRRLCHAALEPVLDTLRYLHQETRTWLEVTTLLIPGENDNPDDLARAAGWLVRNLGPDVPWHLTAFHPDYHMLDTAPTSRELLVATRAVAHQHGLRHVYLGNLPDAEGSRTRCSHCGASLLWREGFSLLQNTLVEQHHCPRCHEVLAGCFS